MRNRFYKEKKILRLQYAFSIIKKKKIKVDKSIACNEINWAYIPAHTEKTSDWGGVGVGESLIIICITKSHEYLWTGKMTGWGRGGWEGLAVWSSEKHTYTVFIFALGEMQHQISQHRKPISLSSESHIKLGESIRWDLHEHFSESTNRLKYSMHMRTTISQTQFWSNLE